MTSTSSNLPAPCPASTSDVVEFHAIQSPNKAAIAWDQKSRTYSDLNHDLLKVTRALYDMGLRPGQFALIHQINPYSHVLLLLACENLRVATASLPTLGATMLFEKADFLLSSEEALNLPLAMHLVNEQWFAKVTSLPPHEVMTSPKYPKDMNDLVRITRSSGTTGQPKLIRLNRTQFEYSIQGQLEDKNLTKDSVFLVAYGFEIMSIWGQVSACLRAGGTVAWGSLAGIAEQYPLSHVWLMPAGLSNLLNSLPANARKFSGTTIYTAGAPVPEMMRSKARELLGVEVINWFGANEVSAICTLDSKQCGVLKPGIEVKVVDDEGLPVGWGVEGALAFRSPGMIHAYWDQPEYTKKYFQDGWFYPGDRGRLLQPRVLQHLGRNDEMLNFGGIKQSPELIEKVFKSLPNVLDAGATSMTRQDGVDVLLVAVVLSNAADLPYIKRDALARLSSLAQQMHIFACEALPRTANGKLKRLAIRDLVKDLP